jgi:uncharacterized membrane protein YkvA (DUF1232 family)
MSNEEKATEKNANAEKARIEALEEYAKHYDRNAAFKLLKKLRKKTRGKKWLVSKSVGVIVNTLGHLMSALDNPETPKRHKAAIIIAVGYIILPFDMMPDILPIVGYSDDVMVAGSVLALVMSYSTFKLEDLDAEIDRQGPGVEVP